ncbi:MAG: YceI family protein [Bacteroidota bacterium]
MGKVFHVLTGLALLVTLGAAPLLAGAPVHLTALKGDSFLKYILVHPLHHVEGVSKEVTCSMDYDDATHTVTAASFQADVASFDSGNSSRDSHAMEVLDALEYPEVSFTSKSITSSGRNMQVQGDLTFHGQTKPVAFPATLDAAGSKISVEGNAAVSLTAFGIERPSLLLIPVEDTLHISFTMVFPNSGLSSK